MERTPSLKAAAEFLWQPLPEQRDRCPELSLDGAAGPRLTSLPSTGLENMVEWLGGGTAAFSMVLCVFVHLQHIHSCNQAAEQGIPPSPGLCLPSPVHVRKTPAEGNQSNEQTVRADPECLWLVD